MNITITILLVASLHLGGCADPNVQPIAFQVAGRTDSVVLGPNLRTISERFRSVAEGQGPLPTRCSEPSPDVAIAFTRTESGNAKFSEGSGPTGEGGFNLSQAEASQALEGRTAGVLALRDGLSAACQAYVNGVIGQDAYALILSQYGNLLVALAGTGTAGSEAPHLTAQETALTALLVSCISEHDPTRLGAYRTNELLSFKRCSRLMDGVVAGRLLKATATKEAAAPKKATIETPSVTVNVAPAKGA